MRVLHWDANFLSGGAVANSVLALATSQARLGADVAIAAAESSAPPLYEPMRVEGGVRIIGWRPRWTFRVDGFLLRGVSRTARHRLRAFKPDVVHVHGGFNPDNWWVPRLFECAIVFSPHGTFHPEVFRKSRRVAKSLYLRLERYLLYRHVSAFHALSPTESMHVERMLNGRRVYCVPQGPGVRVDEPRAPEMHAKSNGHVEFVFVGRLDVFTKGLDLLLEAFAEAGKRLGAQHITLTLAGPEWRGGMGWLWRRGRELGVSSRVTLTGALSGTEIASILRRSHIYVQLSRHDGFSLSVSEALVAGKPAILSEAVGPASYPEVASLPHVRVVPLRVNETADAMVDFVTHLDSLQGAAERCQPQVCDFFSWERIAESQLSLYRQITVGEQ